MSIKIIVKKLLSKMPFLDGIFRRFIWSRVHFPEVEMRFLNDLKSGSIDVAVDVGAALGCYSWLLNRVSNTVYAFEPGNIHSNYLKSVIFSSNIKLIKSAVGSGKGSVNLYTPGSDTDALHSATLSQGNPVVNSDGIVVDTVEQVSLDDFLKDKLGTNKTLDLLKVDVEGYELEVFKGAVNLLNKHHPLIICEIEARHNVNYAEVFNKLRGVGYSSFIYRSGSYERFDDESIEDLQLKDDLEMRLSDKYDLLANKYINNFVFQHPESRVKVKE